MSPSPVQEWLSKILLQNESRQHCGEIADILAWISIRRCRQPQPLAAAVRLAPLTFDKMHLTRMLSLAKRQPQREERRDSSSTVKVTIEDALGHKLSWARQAARDAGSMKAGQRQLVHMPSLPLLCCFPNSRVENVQNARWEGPTKSKKSCGPWLPVCCLSFVRASRRSPIAAAIVES